MSAASVARRVKPKKTKSKSTKKPKTVTSSTPSSKTSPVIINLSLGPSHGVSGYPVPVAPSGFSATSIPMRLPTTYTTSPADYTGRTINEFTTATHTPAPASTRPFASNFPRQVRFDTGIGPGYQTPGSSSPHASPGPHFDSLTDLNSGNSYGVSRQNRGYGVNDPNIQSSLNLGGGVSVSTHQSQNTPHTPTTVFPIPPITPSSNHIMPNIYGSGTYSLPPTNLFPVSQNATAALGLNNSPPLQNAAFANAANYMGAGGIPVIPAMPPAAPTADSAQQGFNTGTPQEITKSARSAPSISPLLIRRTRSGVPTDTPSAVTKRTSRYFKRKK